VIRNFLANIRRRQPLRAEALEEVARPEEVWILAPPDSPSRDVYQPHIMKLAKGARVEFADSSLPPTACWQPAKHAWVVVIRYACKPWLHCLWQHRKTVSKVTWFMDDDIPSITSARELPADYRRKTDRRYRAMRPIMAKLGATFAFSTSELAARYPDTNADIWRPSFVTGSSRAALTYFYHGTSAHIREIQWLVPIVREVQKQVPDAWFEVMCDGYVKKLFHGIPRIKCLHALGWSDYLDYTACHPKELGLAPLLETPLNMARAPVKFFDITRSGAGGIYSKIGPFPSLVRHEETGLLLENNPTLWIESIVDLLGNEERRNRMAAAAREFCLSRCL